MPLIEDYVDSLSETEYYKQAYRYYNEDSFHQIESWTSFLDLALDFESNRLRPIALSRSGKDAFDDAFQRLELQARRSRLGDRSPTFQTFQPRTKDEPLLDWRKNEERESHHEVNTDSAAATPGGTINRPADIEATHEEPLNKPLESKEEEPVAETSRDKDPEGSNVEDKDPKEGERGGNRLEEECEAAKPGPEPEIKPSGGTEEITAVKDAAEVDGTDDLIQKTEDLPEEASAAQEPSTSPEQAVGAEPASNDEPQPSPPADIPETAPEPTSPGEPPSVASEDSPKDRYYEGFGGRWVVNGKGRWRDKRTGKPCTHGPGWVREPRKPGLKK
ncbi:hypothetical protein P7C71_g3626, partial [Lecanoromycetidae sp. Uapishka_2]